MDTNPILESLKSPEELEHLYQNNKEQFKIWLDQALIRQPDREILGFWNARLNYNPAQQHLSKNSGLLFVVALCVVSGLLVKLPEFFPIDIGWYHPRFTPLIVVSALIAYFSQKIETNYIKIWVAFGILFCLLILLVLPDYHKSSSINMSLIHMPLVLLSLLALGFMGKTWKSTESRLAFVGYLGETLIYSSMIILGGGVLTTITLSLFRLIDVPIDDFYFKYIAVIGLVSSPVVATYLYDSVLGRGSKIATLLSRVFSPLLLITVLIYLATVIYQGKTPYSDRFFLITFNGLLVVVWGITVFSIAGVQNTHLIKLSDKINVALISVTLIINAIALSAILYRLSKYGLTPNRVAVTGANILIFIHLILILKAYMVNLKKGNSVKSLPTVIANYLPIYSGWSLFVVVVLPVIFWFK